MGLSLKSLTKGFKAVANPFGSLGGLMGGSTGPSGQADVLATLRRAEEESRIRGLQAQAQQRAALPVVQKAFTATRENLAQQAERTKRLMARDASMNPTLSRVDALGMGASSLAPIAARGVRGDLARAYQEIDSHLAGALGPLAGQEAGLQAGILGGAAGLNLQALNAENNARFQLAQAFARPRRRKKGLLDLVGAAAPIVGMMAGGGGGAGAFASLGTQALGQNAIDDYMNNGSGYGSY